MAGEDVAAALLRGQLVADDGLGSGIVRVFVSSTFTGID